jgi:hypothetical protein
MRLEQDAERGRDREHRADQDERHVRHAARARALAGGVEQAVVTQLLPVRADDVRDRAARRRQGVAGADTVPRSVSSASAHLVSMRRMAAHGTWCVEKTLRTSISSARTLTLGNQNAAKTSVTIRPIGATDRRANSGSPATTLEMTAPTPSTAITTERMRPKIGRYVVA